MLFLYIHHILHVLSQLNKNVSQLSHIIQLLVHGQGSQELLLRVSVNAVRASIDISHVRRGSWIWLFQSIMSVISSHCKFIIGIMKSRTDLSPSSWAISVLVWPSINLLSRINAYTRPTTCYWLVSCELCTDTDHWRADLPNCNNLNPVFGDT